MAGIIANKFVRKTDKLDYSRSIFNYEKRHSTNLLSGMIVPVHTQFLYPGTSPDWNFGCVIESAPLISTNLDNIYVDIISIWCPMRLVMTDWNEFLGESHTQAFTINRNITIPKLTSFYVTTAANITPGGSRNSISRAYLADNYLAPHLGYRKHADFDASAIQTGSIFKKGISVIPSRIYELNWNTFFRNENVQAPILIDKTSVVGSHDATYAEGLGHLQEANKLKTWYSIATPNPSLLDVSISMGELLPVVAGADHSVPASSYIKWVNADTGVAQANRVLGTDASGLGIAGSTSVGTNQGGTVPTNLWADTAALTVNRMYYALMEQKFANKMMKGRRAVEFYQNFFGVTDSEAGHDLPQLLCHKRFPLNISQVIATGAGSNGSETTDLGQRGAFSTTGFGDSLVKNFIASEHGYIQTYLIIRGQPSLASGINHDLGIDSLLDTYIPEFDHIGPVGIDELEVTDATSALYFGFTNAWYAERNQVSDCVGIIEPGQPLAYKTLAQDYNSNAPVVISDSFLRHDPRLIDRIFTFPVCYGNAGTSGFDGKGEEYLSNRYQFLCQFVVKGKFAAVMSPDSEPLKLRL